MAGWLLQDECQPARVCLFAVGFACFFYAALAPAEEQQPFPI